ncbi:hypothetical protein [Aquisediminimonas sediminicola]|uniref:hypothetical protein n=1 Tax=Alteraquisediminimonas sediminicola TaxID=2676787 RepID=UPI001C8DEE73|nr:hypothetical protein [Aquisediminimonas sediminicola]
MGGAQVTSWKDKSANAYTAGDATSYGATTHSLPTYSAGNGVSFDGTTNILEVVGGIYPNNAAISDSDYFIVTTSVTNKYQFLFYNNLPTTSSGPRISAHMPWIDSTIYWDHSTRIAISWGGNSSVYNRKYIYNLGASVSGQQSIARDGNILSSINGSSATIYTKLSTHTFFLGNGYTGSGASHNGVISEFIVYSRRLNSAEKNILQSYLAAKHANPGGAGAANRYTNTVYKFHVGGIGQESDGSLTTGTSAGLTIANTSFLATGNYVLAGLPALSPATGSTAADVPTGFNARSQRIWYLNRTGTGTGAISLSFKLSDLGMTATNGQRLALLSRSETTGTFASLATTNYNGSGTASFSISDPQTGYYVLALAPLPILTASLSNIVQSDGINVSDFKAIPNALIKVSANMTNSGQGSPDANSTTLTLPVPANMTFFVGDIGSVGGGPVTFNQGSPTSSLTYTYTALGSTSDGLEFSNDSGTTWTYAPVPDGQQGDTHITHVRIKPGGSFATSTAAPFPNFSVDYGLLVK